MGTRPRTAERLGGFGGTRGFDASPRDAHRRALRKLGALGDYLTRQDARLKGADARGQAGASGARGAAGDMQEPDSPPPRHYPIEEADAGERAVGRRLRCAFWTLTGETPHLLPGDTSGARMFLGRITAAIERGGWTRNEWTTLYEMERKWRARAEGRDPRFMAAGTKPGRLKKPEEQKVRIARDRERQVERFRR